MQQCVGYFCAVMNQCRMADYGLLHICGISVLKNATSFCFISEKENVQQHHSVSAVVNIYHLFFPIPMYPHFYTKACLIRPFILNFSPFVIGKYEQVISA
jgi:hypothetical protein